MEVAKKLGCTPMELVDAPLEWVYRAIHAMNSEAKAADMRAKHSERMVKE